MAQNARESVANGGPGREPNSRRPWAYRHGTERSARLKSRAFRSPPSHRPPAEPMTWSRNEPSHGQTPLAFLSHQLHQIRRMSASRNPGSNKEESGFELSLKSSYGRSVSGVVLWVPPPERSNSERGGFLACCVEFRPRPDGTLGKGSWKEPWQESVSSELCRELRQRAPSSPVQVLTDTGKEKLLAMFEWTPLSRMTTKQARGARVEFIRANPGLKGNTRALAEALRNASLYAASTTVHQVMKFLPSLISESELRV